MILVIDNYDSFVFNLTRYIRQLVDVPTVVQRNDTIDIEQVELQRPKAIIISPGPCAPEQSGQSLALIERFASSVPILGVCLGHQAIVQAFGGTIVRADAPVHGRASQVTHDNSTLFQNVPSPFVAGRYHSLVAAPNSIPDEIVVTARTSDQTVMAVEHRHLPVFGVQFHPESILTEHGHRLIFNFLIAAGLEPGLPDPTIADGVQMNQTAGA